MSAYGDALKSMIEGFEYENCDECGRDLDHHIIIPVMGLPFARCAGAESLEDAPDECGEHGENEPTCDICEKGQCSTPEMEWNGETGNHVECEEKLILAKRATPGGCVEDHKVTCGNCDASWCEECDPAPAALCHYCHGRGYSTAEIIPPKYARND